MKRSVQVLGANVPIVVPGRGRRRSVATRRAFSPLQVPGLVAWYDFADASTLFTNTTRTTRVGVDGDPIRGVADKSQNGYHLSEVPAKAPVYKTNIRNSRSVCRLGNGTNDGLTATGLPTRAAQTVVIVAVKRAPIDNATRALWSTGNRSGVLTYQTSSATQYLWNSDETVSNAPIGISSVQSWNIISMTTPNTTSMSFRSNGGTATATINPHDNVATNTDVKLGYDSQSGTFAPDYDVAELLIYNAVLSSTNHDALGRYLSEKWAIAWTAVV